MTKVWAWQGRGTGGPFSRLLGVSHGSSQVAAHSKSDLLMEVSQLQTCQSK